MGEQQGTAQEWAEIEQVLPVAGRERGGLVLALKDGFGGIIPTDGMVRGERGTSAYVGPTSVEDWGTSGAWRSWTAVIATADDVAQLFRAGDAVAFSPRREPCDEYRVARAIELDAQGWTTVLDFYDALLPALGAPAWHGRSINALIDSLVWGGINTFDPPYEVRITGVHGLESRLRWQLEQIAKAIDEQRADFYRERGHDPGASLKVIS